MRTAFRSSQFFSLEFGKNHSIAASDLNAENMSFQLKMRQK